MVLLYKDLIQPDDEPRFVTKFQILTEDHLPFEYIINKEGDCITDSDSAGLQLAAESKYIHILEENIPGDLGRFHGTHEPILNGKRIKFVEPAKGARQIDGEDLHIGNFGDWKCLHCGHINVVPVVSSKIVKPFICNNDECGRKGQFKALFPEDLIKPIWKLPLPPIEANGTDIYSEIYNYCKSQLILEDEDYHILTTWIMASWLVDDFQTCPYLCMLAPKESGKTQVLDVISELGYRATKTISVTAPSLFRAIELWHITLLIDEAEYQLKQETEAGQALYGCLNGGYKRGSYAIRTEGESNNRIPTAYDVFGFKAIATTQLFHPTLESRSIIINMSQGMPDKILIDTKQAMIIRAKLLFWRFETLTKLPLVMPESNKGRLIEMFIPLFTVAQILKEKTGRKLIITHQELIKILQNKISAMESIRKEEEHTSSDAQIISAINNLSGKPSPGISGTRDNMTIREIAEELKWIDQYTEQTAASKVLAKIGKKLKVMGLKSKHTMHGNIFEHLNEENELKLKELYKRFLDMKVNEG